MSWSVSQSATRGTRTSSLLLFIGILAGLTNVLFVLSLPTNSPTEQVNTCQEFQCKPQDRSYVLNELMKENGQLNQSEEIFHPPYIVVKRCDSHAGCCRQTNSICTVKEESRYTILANVTFGRSIQDQPFTRTIEMENHGECSCTYIQYPCNRTKIDTQLPNVVFTDDITSN